MIIRIVDFILTGLSIWFALHWGDQNQTHMCIVAILIGVAIPFSYFRGLFTNKYSR